MPEGPEVARIAEVINKAAGKIFVKAEIIENTPGVIHKFTKQGMPGLNILQNNPWKLISATAIGKVIQVTIIGNYNSHLYHESFHLLCRLGMSGTWAWDAKDHKHARFNLVTDTGEDLTFLDQRCFGTIEIVDLFTSQERFFVVGHNLLESPMPSVQWKRYKTLMGGKILGPALLEQDKFSGIGNIYKSEILYRTGIKPDIHINDLTDEQWENINQMAHIVLKEAYDAGGSSIREYSADGKEGSYQLQLQAYGRKQCPKGHPITKLKQKSRTTYWCQQCQVLP